MNLEWTNEEARKRQIDRWMDIGERKRKKKVREERKVSRMGIEERINHLPICDNCESIGTRWSYREGAWRMIPHVPTRQAIVKIHRKSLSSTKATYFQSSMTWRRQSNENDDQWRKSERKKEEKCWTGTDSKINQWKSQLQSFHWRQERKEVRREERKKGLFDGRKIQRKKKQVF